jgi:membrane fusion protein, multidrug efflux system
MKNKIVYLMAAALLAACGASTPTDDLGKKRAERDSLKTKYDELGKQIKEIEDWLTENDTTVKRNLPMVKAMDLQVGTYRHYVDVHGSVRADKAATLTSMSGGRVRSINVNVGDRVSAGQLLVTMDNNMAKEQLEQAEAAYDLAKTAFEKQDKLWQQKIGSEMQYLQAKSGKEQAEAAVNTLKEQWRLSNVTAPFSGTVDEVMVRVGDMTAPGLPVVRVVDLSDAQLEADVPESYLSRVKRGAPARVVFPSIGDTVNAQLDHVGEFIDPANRTFKVTVRMPKGDSNVQPNLLSDISIEDAKADSALVVPNSAVLDDVNGNSYIFTLEKTKDEEATAHKVMVKRLSEYKGQIHVRPEKDGTLKGGETIVKEGAKNVSDGQSVRIAKL